VLDVFGGGHLGGLFVVEVVLPEVFVSRQLLALAFTQSVAECCRHTRLWLSSQGSSVGCRTR
jgi:hypothetical protein